MKKETPRSKPKRGVSVSGPKKKPGVATEDDAARAHMEAAIDKYNPTIAALGRKALALMRKRLPGAIEMVYDNYNAFGVGFSGVDKSSKIPLSIVLYPRWITLFFMKGNALPDPERRLEGKGSTVRSIRIETPKALRDLFADDYVGQLMTAAVMNSGWVLERKAKGRVVIKAVVANQRPRRP
jgi:hypothetical protein